MSVSMQENSPVLESELGILHRISKRAPRSYRLDVRLQWGWNKVHLRSAVIKLKLQNKIVHFSMCRHLIISPKLIYYIIYRAAIFTT